MRFLWHVVRWLVRLVFFVGVVAFLGLAYDVAMSKIDAARYKPPGTLVDVGGRKMHLYCTGEAGAGKPTVILEATGVGSVLQYSKIQPEVAARTRVCSYDRAGMGWSDQSGRPPTAQQLADDLDRLLVKAAIAPPYILVAGSAGGLTAEMYARQHPKSVVGLMLLDALSSSVVEAMPATTTAAMEKRACLARAAAHFGVLRFMDPFQIGKSTARDRDVTRALTYRGWTWDTVCGVVKSLPYSLAELKSAPPLRADLPLMVFRHERVGGLTGGSAADDQAVESMWQAEQQKVAARSSKGELIVANDSAHLIAVDRPDLVVATLLKMVAPPAAPVAVAPAKPVVDKKHHHGSHGEPAPEARPAEPAPEARPAEPAPEARPAEPRPQPRPIKPHVDEDE